MGRWGRRALKVGLVLVLLLVLLVAALPWLARPTLESALSVALGRTVSIATLRWSTNPLSVVADDVRIGSAPDQLAVRRITVAADPLAISRTQVVIDRVGIEAPSGTIALDEIQSREEGRAPGAPPALPVPLLVREIAVSDAALTLRPPRATGADLALVVSKASATDIALDAGTLALNAAIDGTLEGAPLTGTAEVRLGADERLVNGSLAVKQLALSAGQLPLPAPLASLAGTLDATARLAIGEPAGRADVQLDLRLAKARIAMPSGGTLSAASVALPAVQVDLAAHRVDLGAVSVQQPVATLDLAATPERAPAEESSSAPSWTVRSGVVSIRGGELRLRRGEAASALRLERVRWDGLRDAATPLSFTATAADGGTLAVDGTIRVDPLSADLAVRVDDLAAPAWSRFVDLPVQLGRGTVSGSAKLDYRDGLRAVTGDLRASDVKTLPPDAARPTELMAVATAAATFSYTPGDPALIDVSSATLSYPYVMVVRRGEGTFPYSLLTGGAAGGGARTTLHVAQANVVGGKVEFVDETLQPPFWTSLTGMSASAARGALPPGTVEHFTLAGKRDELSPVSVSGAVTADGLDARVEVADILLDSLNPYVAPLLGYRITAGRLSTVATATPKPPLLVSVADVTLNGVDVLQTGTDVILEQSGVPLPIALSLIADSGGQIDLNLPFSVNTTSGDVAVGSVVWQAVRKAIVTALTSPLRILGSLFGTGGAPHAFAVDPIPFATGSAALDAAGRERVDQIARIVQAHQGLLVVLLPQLTAADLAAAAGADGAKALAAQRNQATREALVDRGLPAKCVLLSPWEPAKGAKATERAGVYVELQDAG